MWAALRTDYFALVFNPCSCLQPCAPDWSCPAAVPAASPPTLSCRGLQLKVPEVVPFRLTQTLVGALGVTGVEGGFRRGCERALSALNANAAPLCALLEASLLDPGADWEAEAAARAASRVSRQEREGASLLEGSCWPESFE